MHTDLGIRSQKGARQRGTRKNAIRDRALVIERFPGGANIEEDRRINTKKARNIITKTRYRHAMENRIEMPRVLPVRISQPDLKPCANMTRKTQGSKSTTGCRNKLSVLTSGRGGSAAIRPNTGGRNIARTRNRQGRRNRKGSMSIPDRDE
jgi:hypothetical protein